MDPQSKRETEESHEKRDKSIEITILGDASEEYKKINSSNDSTLKNSLQQKILFLKENPEYGKKIAKKKIPKHYFRDYDVTNLWKANLPKAWRLIYTLMKEDNVLNIVILDIFDHKRYEKVFGYRKK